MSQNDEFRLEDDSQEIRSIPSGLLVDPLQVIVPVAPLMADANGLTLVRVLIQNGVTPQEMNAIVESDDCAKELARVLKRIVQNQNHVENFFCE